MASSSYTTGENWCVCVEAAECSKEITEAVPRSRAKVLAAQGMTNADHND